jgi:hypothetical protein
VRELQKRIIALPQTLDEMLLELDDCFVYLSWDSLQTLTLLVHLLKFHSYLHHTVDLERSQLSNDCKRFFENRVLYYFVSEHVAQYEKKRL